MSELRAALLILGVVFIAVLAWSERRRRRQARQLGGEPPEPAERHEPAFELPEIHPHEPMVPRPSLALRDPQAARELPILEVPAPIEPAAEPVVSDGEPGAVAAAAAGATDQPGPALPELPSASPPLVEWPPDAQRRVVALRLVAPQPERFAGRSVRQALAAEGFVLGRFDIFHKPDEERRAVVSAASLTRPGTFDVETMDSQHYGGLSLFAVLPGPMPPPQAFEELVSTARSLNDRLCGVLQDESGTPLTPARIATLRERIRSGAGS